MRVNGDFKTVLPNTSRYSAASWPWGSTDHIFSYRERKFVIKAPVMNAYEIPYEQVGVITGGRCVGWDRVIILKIPAIVI